MNNSQASSQLCTGSTNEVKKKSPQVEQKRTESHSKREKRVAGLICYKKKRSALAPAQLPRESYKTKGTQKVIRSLWEQERRGRRKKKSINNRSSVADDVMPSSSTKSRIELDALSEIRRFQQKSFWKILRTQQLVYRSSYPYSSCEDSRSYFKMEYKINFISIKKSLMNFEIGSSSFFFITRLNIISFYLVPDWIERNYSTEEGPYQYRWLDILLLDYISSVFL